MRYDIWHADPPNFLALPARFEQFPLGYTHVATVEATCVEETFQLTNHIDGNWVDGPQVVEKHAALARSTSVGDVVVAPDGDEWRVMPIGWESRRAKLNASFTGATWQKFIQ